jgi:hypothetical protein
MELFGALAVFGFVIQVIIIGLLAAAFPLFWIWMLVDAVLRDDSEYPGGGENDKLVWVLLIALVQVVAVFYFFMVYRKVKRSPASRIQAGSTVSPPVEATTTAA